MTRARALVGSAMLAVAAIVVVVSWSAQRAFEKQSVVTLECERSAIAAADKTYQGRTPFQVWMTKEETLAYACMTSRGYQFNSERQVCGPHFEERYVAPFCYVPVGWHGWWFYVLANSNGMD